MLQSRDFLIDVLFAIVRRDKDYVILVLGLCSPRRLMNPVSTWDPNYTSTSALSAHNPMLENRWHAHSRRSIAPREIFLPVEVYISNQAAAALRKVHSYLSRCGVPLIQRSQIA